MILDVITSTLVNDSSGIIINTAQTVTSSIYANILQTAKPFLALIGGLIGLYLIYLIIQLIFSYIQNKRIKRILENSELMLKRIERVEERLGKIKKSK